MYKFFHTLIGLIFAVIVAFFIAEAILPTENGIYSGECEEFKAQWYYVDKDGEKIDFSVPGVVECERGEWSEISCVLPDIPDSRHALLTRSSQQDLYFYVDGELRKVYTTEDTRIFGKSSMSGNVLVYLDKEDSGKVLTIKSKSVTSYSGLYNTIYYGLELDLYKSLFDKNFIGVAVAFILLYSGIVVLIICVVIQIKYRTVFSMLYAAVAVIVASLLAILESRLRQFYIPNITIAGFFSYFMIGLFPIATLLYCNAVQKERYKKQYYAFIFVCFANIIVNVLLQITNVQDMLGSLTRTYALYVLSFFLICYTFYTDYKKKLLMDIKFTVAGVVLCYAMAIGEIVITIMHIIVITGLFINIGMGFLLLAAIMESFQQLNMINEERISAISANVAKQNFLANMSHEIRTPLNAILGLNEMILRESEEDDVRAYSSNIKSAGNNLLDIINDILDLSKIESGKLEILNEEYSLSSLIGDINNIISVRADSKNLKFSITADDNLPEKMLGDEYRIRQVLLNLLNNAIKYTDKGSVLMNIAGVYGDNDEFRLKVEVKDTGIGISAEDLPKIFNSFERINMKHNKNIEGTGLGLAITSNLVDRMNGEIKVESKYGNGSTFTVIIPQETVGDEKFDLKAINNSNDLTKEPTYKESFRAPDAKILIVDDYRINLTVIKGLLKKTGIIIKEATSGKECIKEYANDEFDMILMDHMMPEMDGIETFNRLKELHDNLCPVIILTANAIEGVKDKYMGEGFADYLSKPVNPLELESVIKKHLPENKCQK